MVDGAIPQKSRRSLSAREWLMQIGIVAAVLGVIFGIGYITNSNLRARGIVTGFDFLWYPSRIPIASASIPFTVGVDTYGRSFLVGVVNTLKISLLAIVLSTILGTLVGIARLSSNWLLSRACLWYVELCRNVPLLLQLLFWYQLLHNLPGPRQAFSPAEGIYLSNRGIRFPAFDLGPNTGWILVIALAGFALAGAWAYLLRDRDAVPSGRPKRYWLWIVGLFPAIAACIMLNATPTTQLPELKGFDFRGGSIFSVELAALLLGMTLYAATFVSEIVRSGILAVSKGQWEAAAALGLSNGLTLRKVILPQTMRIVVPPLTGEYLGIVKNASLAIAVGYQDLVSVMNGIMSDTGQAIESILLIVAAYVAISLALSLAMSRYEAAMAIKER